MSTHTLAPPSATRSATRTAAIAGLAWFIAGFGTFVPEPPPPGAADAGAIRSYIADSQTTLTVNAFSAIVGAIALVAMTSALSRLAETHRRHAAAATFISGVGAIAAVQMLVFTSVCSVWVFADAEEMSDVGVVTVHQLTVFAEVFGIVCLGLTLAMVAVVSWLALRDRFLSRPLAVLGLVIVAAECVSLAGLSNRNSVFDTAMYIAIFGWFLWPAMVSADLGVRLVRSRRLSPADDSTE